MITYNQTQNKISYCVGKGTTTIAPIVRLVSVRFHKEIYLYIYSHTYIYFLLLKTAMIVLFLNQNYATVRGNAPDQGKERRGKIFPF